MTDKLSDSDRDSYMKDLDRSLKFNALVERQNIDYLIEVLCANLNTLLYTHQIWFLLELRKNLEREFVHSTRDIVIQTISLAEQIRDYKEITGEAHLDYGNELGDDTVEEFRQRDRDVLMFLEQSPLIKQHIETKLNMTLEEIFQ